MALYACSLHCLLRHQVEAKIASRASAFLADASANGGSLDTSLADLWTRSGLAVLYNATRVFHTEQGIPGHAGPWGTSRARPAVVEALMAVQGSEARASQSTEST